MQTNEKQIPVEITYRSKDVLIAIKPAGVPFHQTNDSPGFVQLVRDAIDTEPEQSSPPGRIYPVHRLDAVTSGLVVFARSKTAARELSQAFSNGRVAKRYVAISDRKPSKKQGLVVGDMVRSRRGSWRLTRDKKRPARTRLSSISLAARRPGLRLFLLQPETGRTHQLRVALKSLGAPILGDAMYGNAADAALVDRAYLHACGLSFEIGGETITVVHQPDHGVEFCSETFIDAWKSLGDLF